MNTIPPQNGHRTIKTTRIAICLAAALAASLVPASAMSLKVYIMAGQSNEKLVPWTREFRKAMAAPASMPEFKGNVAAVFTENFWEPKLEELQLRFEDYKKLIDEVKSEQIAGLKEKPSLRRVTLTAESEAKLEARRKGIYSDDEWKLMETGISNAPYHYLGSYKIYSRIGKAFADSLVGMSK